MGNKELRQFMIELEFIGKNKSYIGIANKIAKSFSFKNVDDLLQDKKKAYDFQVSKLFDMYGVENDSLFDEFDVIWVESLEVGKKETIKYMCMAMIGVNTKTIEMNAVMKSYIGKTNIYCSDFVKELINE
ncbi:MULTISPECIES: hypothetical protein [Clostridium]|uniref:Uncharacterized protein n=1 Tax=Clostridium frigoriphilum TaxID=443253 RepID=A0ABU7UQ29_9CLOT|nr:hypothetical protein [Clostridium sp. DSM 17811]MBU3100682.1 hypothetical protein [Clostridium sp. DSM 17811]